MARKAKASEPVASRQVNIRIKDHRLRVLEEIGATLGLDVPQVVHRAIDEYLENWLRKPPIQRRQ